MLSYQKLSAMLFLGVMGPGSIAVTRAIAQEPEARTPVLMIHGTGMDSSTWTPLLEALKAAGYPDACLSALDLKPADGSNTHAAREQIAPAVDRLLRAARADARERGRRLPEKVDIVAHSMGALSTRWYLQRLRPEKVRVWIGIAPANHGSDALCLYPSAGNAQLCPAFSRGQWAQAALNGIPDKPLDETPWGLGQDVHSVPSVPPDRRRWVAYYTLRLDPDRWITPASSAVLDGAGGLEVVLPTNVPARETTPGNFLFEAAVGHDVLPKDARAIDFVRAVIRAADSRELQARIRPAAAPASRVADQR